MDSIDREVLERTLEWVRSGHRVGLAPCRLRAVGARQGRRPRLRHHSQPDFLNCRYSSATAIAVSDNTIGYPTTHSNSGMFSKFMP